MKSVDSGLLFGCRFSDVIGNKDCSSRNTENFVVEKGFSYMWAIGSLEMCSKGRVLPAVPHITDSLSQ